MNSPSTVAVIQSCSWFLGFEKMILIMTKHVYKYCFYRLVSFACLAGTDVNHPGILSESSGARRVLQTEVLGGFSWFSSFQLDFFGWLTVAFRETKLAKLFFCCKVFVISGNVWIMYYLKVHVGGQSGCLGVSFAWFRLSQGETMAAKFNRQSILSSTFTTSCHFSRQSEAISLKKSKQRAIIKQLQQVESLSFNSQQVQLCEKKSFAFYMHTSSVTKQN